MDTECDAMDSRQLGRVNRGKRGREGGREGGREEGTDIYIYMFRAFYQSAQFINWPAQSRNYRLGAQFINRVRNLEIESRAINERSVHVLFIT